MSLADICSKWRGNCLSTQNTVSCRADSNCVNGCTGIPFLTWQRTFTLVIFQSKLMQFLRSSDRQQFIFHCTSSMHFAQCYSTGTPNQLINIYLVPGRMFPETSVLPLAYDTCNRATTASHRRCFCQQSLVHFAECVSLVSTVQACCKVLVRLPSGELSVATTGTSCLTRVEREVGSDVANTADDVDKVGLHEES